MAISIAGGFSGNLAEVNSNNQLQTNLPVVRTQAGYVLELAENDNGALYGSKYLQAPYISDGRKLQVGQITPLLSYCFNTTAQDSGVHRYVTATMTSTWGTTGLLLNASSTLTTTTGTAVATWKNFVLLGSGALQADILVNVTAAPLANQIVELGFFPFAAGTAAPTEGVYFRYSNAGLYGAINFNGSETQSGQLAASTYLSANTTVTLSIIIYQGKVYFLGNGQLLPNGILATPAAQGQPFITTALPLTLQFRNNGAVTGTAMQAKILNVNVNQYDANQSKPFPHVQAAQGLFAYQQPAGGTMGSTALYTNSLAAGSGAAGSNTASIISGLGGQATLQPTLAVGTDFIISSYLNPAGGINQIPRTLYVTGVSIIGAVTAGLTGGPVTVAYSVSFGSNAISLATAEGVAAKAPRRIPLGFENYPASSIVGTLGQGVSRQFLSPIVVNPTEYFQVVGKNLGVITSSGTVTYLITVDGYWE